MQNPPATTNRETVPFIFDEGRTYHSMWYFPIPPTEDNLLGGNTCGLIWKFDDEDHWRLTYRMRYYNSRDVHDQNDRKSWYNMSFKPIVTPELLLPMCRSFFVVGIPAVYGKDVTPDEPNTFDVLMLEGDHRKALEVVKASGKHWLNVSNGTPRQKP